MLKLLGTASVIGLAGCADEPEDGGAGEGGPEEDDGAAPDEETPEEGMEEETPEEETPEEEEEETPEEEGQYSLTVIVESDQGEPIEGATVSIEDDEGILGVFGDQEEEAETDAEGQVVAENLQEGEYTVTVRHENWGEAQENAQIQGSDEEVTVTLQEEGEAADEDGEGNESDGSGS